MEENYKLPNGVWLAAQSIVNQASMMTHERTLAERRIIRLKATIVERAKETAYDT